MPTAPKTHRPPGSRSKQQRQQAQDRQRATDPARRERKRLYDSIAWKRLRRYVLQTNPLCAECNSRGRLTPATEVDHVLSLEDGGAMLDTANLAALCHRCHSSKTAREDRGFGRRRKGEGQAKV